MSPIRKFIPVFLTILLLLAAVFFGSWKAIEFIRVRNAPLVPIAKIHEALENDRTGEAMLYCQKRILTNPDDTLSYLLLGECLEQKYQVKQAIKVYSEISSKNVEEPLPYFYLGRAYYKKGETDRAVGYLKIFKDLSDRALIGEAKAESRKQAALFLATIYMESKAYRKAIPELQSVLESEPQNQDVRYELGTAYAYSGQYQSAYREFQKIVDESPGTETARYAENAIQYVRERRSPDKSRTVLLS